MSKRIFTREQIKQLLSNENVVRVGKTIVYNKDFKIKAIAQYEQGLRPQEIFRDAGFDLNTIGRQVPKQCLKRWNKIFRLKGADGIKIETRGKSKGGGRPKTKNLTDTEKIKWLETENAYLKAENDFLAKLRAKRAE
jgi:transposase-like protein